jgi:hypothetical protein
MPKKQEIAWQPQAGPQEAAIRAGFVDELFYGGAAGGGKSDFLLGDFLSDVDQGSAWQGMLFRQSFPALDDLVRRSHEIFPQVGGRWLQGKYDWRFPNGAVLHFRHFETIFDFAKYQGASLSWIGFDELGEWADPQCYNRMKSRLRGMAKNKRIRSSGNPGGIGHGWVQEYFRIPMHRTSFTESVPFKDEKSGMLRLFIPSRVQDNKILMESDPDYMDRLRGVGDDELVKAWLDGDWGALVGAYFSRNWSKVELIDSFEIPPAWPVFTGLDYGEASPTACIWAAVDYDKNLILFNEYHEVADSASEHAEEVVARQKSYPFCQSRPRRNIADPNFFVRRRISQAKVNTAADQFRENGMRLIPGNNNRINGWRILNDAMSKGKIKIFKEWCPKAIESIPRLSRNIKKPEDAVDDGDATHICDAIRYLAVHVYGPSMAKKESRGSDADNVLDSLVTQDSVGTRYG